MQNHSASHTPYPLYWPDVPTKNLLRWLLAITIATVPASIFLGFTYHSGWFGLLLLQLFAAAVLTTYPESQKRERIFQQLELRKKIPLESWPDPERNELAQSVGQIIAKHCDWPNSFFIPEDLVEILFFCPGGGTEGFEVSEELQKKYGLSLSSLLAGETWSTLTYGALIAKAQSLLHASSVSKEKQTPLPPN